MSCGNHCDSFLECDACTVKFFILENSKNIIEIIEKNLKSQICRILCKCYVFNVGWNV